MNKENWIKNIIIVSGGFDPVHKGHIRMFREAANFGGNVIVGLNSDDWLTRKKGKPFMEFEERKEILESFKYVNQVLPFDDSDDTASDLIKRVHSYFNNAKIFAVLVIFFFAIFPFLKGRSVARCPKPRLPN